MVCFPQLNTGSVAQFPILRTIVHRTVLNQLEGGNAVRLGDSVRQIKWQLVYSGLADSEWNTLASFFESMRGRLQTFTFVDPLGNLLSWSDNLAQAPWSLDPLLQVGTGFADPAGGTSALQMTNAGQAVQGVQQSLGTPASMQYCFSLFARSDQSSAVTLRVSAGTTQTEKAILTSDTWSRFYYAPLLSMSDPVAFGLSVPAGGSVQVYGMQVEAQPNPGIYKRTTAQGGVYTKTRFAQDVLNGIAEAPGRFGASISVVTTLTGA